uniref:heme o synthase n=1 Tax=Candidatus Planktophila sp. TaxID=2175601 RepID=UPI00404A5FF4
MPNKSGVKTSHKVRGFIDLMKLRVVELLLVSTLPAMVLAEQGLPTLTLTLATLIGGTLAAGSANAFNMVIESESDKLMKRTAKRPLATGVLTKTEALIFAMLIGLLSLLIFAVYTNTLTTALTATAIIFYVWVYTILLKKRTPQNIVWGGAAGCMPALIGWAAVTNSLSITAWSFFLVIFFWTPPHFWALAIKYKDDYAAAHIPMLPVVASKTHLLRQMWIYTIAMIASSIALIINAELQNWAMALTVVLGLVFAAQLRGLNEKSVNYEKTAGKIFQWSITYLSLLSILLVAAQLLKA